MSDAVSIKILKKEINNKLGALVERHKFINISNVDGMNCLQLEMLRERIKSINKSQQISPLLIIMLSAAIAFLFQFIVISYQSEDNTFIDLLIPFVLFIALSGMTTKLNKVDTYRFNHVREAEYLVGLIDLLIKYKRNN